MKEMEGGQIPFHPGPLGLVRKEHGHLASQLQALVNTPALPPEIGSDTLPPV